MRLNNLQTKKENINLSNKLEEENSRTHCNNYGWEWEMGHKKGIT